MMFALFILLMMATTTALPATTQNSLTPTCTLNLWEGKPPGFIANAGEETTFPQWPETVGNVTVPTIAVYLPPQGTASGLALVYCSGGSYNKVSRISDDVGDARFFVERGAALIVLKYRTTPPGPKDYSQALCDAKRAMRLVRHRAGEWGIDANRIGILGGSAGGHLALTVCTRWDNGNPAADDPVDRETCRPAFASLLCPWPAGQSASDFAITPTTPPAFICSAKDDDVAPASFAQGIAALYEKAGVPVRLWLIPEGGHAAFSTGGNGAEWKERLWAWLRDSQQK